MEQLIDCAFLGLVNLLRFDTVSHKIIERSRLSNGVTDGHPQILRHTWLKCRVTRIFKETAYNKLKSQIAKNLRNSITRTMNPLIYNILKFA